MLGCNQSRIVVLRGGGGGGRKKAVMGVTGFRFSGPNLGEKPRQKGQVLLPGANQYAIHFL